MKAVNLLPGANRGGPRGGGVPGGAYAVVGLLAVLLVMALLYTLSSNQANSRNTQAAAAKQEADQAEARAKSLGAFSSFAKVKDTRTASVSALASGRFDWERYMRELAAVLPDGAWLQQSDASLSGADSGSAAVPSGASATAKPSAHLTGCVRKQDDVASLMVRLRKLYLVDDVSLGSAEKGASTSSSAASGGDCGRFVAFDVTVTFGAAAPTGREAPPGDHAVPARLGGGS